MSGDEVFVPSGPISFRLERPLAPLILSSSPVLRLPPPPSARSHVQSSHDPSSCINPYLPLNQPHPDPQPNSRSNRKRRPPRRPPESINLIHVRRTQHHPTEN